MAVHRKQAHNLYCTWHDGQRSLFEYDSVLEKAGSMAQESEDGQHVTSKQAFMSLALCWVAVKELKSIKLS